MPDRLGIQITNNHATPITFTGIRELARKLRFTTLLPGGCGECSFEIPVDPGMPVSVPNYIGIGFKVEVLDGGEVIWSGRLASATFHHGAGGRYWQVVARGWGVSLSDDVYTSQNVQNTETSTVVSDAVSTLAPSIDAMTVTATGFTLSNAAAINLELLNAAAVVAWAARYGDAAYNPQQWVVYPDADGTIRFTFGDRPTTAEIECYLRDFEQADFGFDERAAANRVVVQYNNGSSYVTVNDTALQAAGPDGWGFIKTAAMVIPEISQSADATQAANAILTAAKSLRMTATSLRTKAGVAYPPFFGSNGQPVAPWRLRAGQLVRLRDVDPGTGAMTNLAFLNSFVIAGTEWDEDGRMLTLTPESYERTLERAAAQVRALLLGRHQV